MSIPMHIAPSGSRSSIRATATDELDLDLNNYSVGDVYRLFGLSVAQPLTRTLLKDARARMLKTHPDKSRLPDAYFRFFAKAYKKLVAIHDFQNKTEKEPGALGDDCGRDRDRDCDRDGHTLANPGAENRHLANRLARDMTREQFGAWFNAKFETSRPADDTVDPGYGDWLASDEDVFVAPESGGAVTPATMGAEIARLKQRAAGQQAALTVFVAPAAPLHASSMACYSLAAPAANATFSDFDAGYADLRQAYAESLIPVLDDDPVSRQKQRTTLGEYTQARAQLPAVPSIEESTAILLSQERERTEQSAARAFHFAQQTELAQKNTQRFWAELKQLM